MDEQKKQSETENNKVEDKKDAKENSEAKSIKSRINSKKTNHTAEQSKELLEQAEKFAALFDKYQRLAAEFDNFKKRTEKEKLSTYDNTLCEVIKSLLPVIDNFERGLNLPEENKESSFYKGIEMVFKQLQSFLTELGVEEIAVNQGDEFNHEIHFAIAHVDDENLGENQIFDVLQKGYKYKDKIIRYSMVRVAN